MIDATLERDIDRLLVKVVHHNSGNYSDNMIYITSFEGKRELGLYTKDGGSRNVVFSSGYIIEDGEWTKTIVPYLERVCEMFINRINHRNITKNLVISDYVDLTFVKELPKMPEEMLLDLIMTLDPYAAKILKDAIDIRLIIANKKNLYGHLYEGNTYLFLIDFATIYEISNLGKGNSFALTSTGGAEFYHSCLQGRTR